MMSESRRNSFALHAMALLALLACPARSWADDDWDEDRRESARQAAEKALASWNASQQFTFKIKDDVYAHTKKPKFGGGLFIYYPEHYGRSHVLQIHPFDQESTSGIEAKIDVPPGAEDLRFLVSGHEDHRGDVAWDVSLDGRNVFSETIKTEGKWKIVRVPVREFAGRTATLSVEARATGWCFEFLFISEIGFAGRRLVMDTGILKLTFEQFAPALATLHMGGRCVGQLRCVLAQFEKEGIGYKKTGVGWSEATSVKAVHVVEKRPDRCVVDVTVQRTDSQETRRKFEAVLRCQVFAGQNWLEGRLISVKNIDTVPYEVRGYSHRLCPMVPGAKPVGYPECGGAVFENGFVAVTERKAGDFSVTFRTAGAGGYGDITRSLNAKLNPGFTWDGAAEPPVVIYVGGEGQAEALFREAARVRRMSLTPEPSGTLKYEEEKAGAK